MQKETLTLAPSDSSYPLFLTAKRYWLSGVERNDGAFTLILFHSTGSHKESWEPVLERLFSLAREANGFQIRDAWSIESPSHGYAAVLNEDRLSNEGITCQKYGEAGYHFLTCFPSAKHPNIDFKNRNIIGIGYSLGGVALSILNSIRSADPSHTALAASFKALILLEPLVFPPTPPSGTPDADPGYDQTKFITPLRRLMVRSLYERTETWRTLDDAYVSLKAGAAKRWDDRVLRAYVYDGGLRKHPGAPKFPTGTDESILKCHYSGVTLSCTKDQEAALYLDAYGPTDGTLDIDRACRDPDLQVHLVLGGRKDWVKPEVHAELVRGRRFDTVTVVEGRGHLIGHEVPETVGEIISSILQRIRAGGQNEVLRVRL